MRRLPAALFAAVTTVPVLVAAVSTPAATAAATGAAVPATSAAASSAVPAGTAGWTAAGSAASRVATRAPVATAIQALPLSGVDVDALRQFAGQSSVPGSRGAPGALAGMATSAPAVLTERTGTADYETLGVTWKATKRAPDLVISVRTRGGKGWSGWEQLDVEAGIDPTASSAAVRGGTEPLWVGPSDGVQVRVVVRSGKLPADLKVELVDPGASAQDALVAPLGQAGLTTGTVSAASANKPVVVTRAQWGADERKVRDAPTYMPTVKAVVLHHTAGRNDYSPAQVPSILRGDYAYHVSRGWDDIGYNALVDRFGRIWEGRGGGLDRPVMGAHAGGFNADTFGVSMIGNYDVRRPSAASIDAVARVAAWKLDLEHRDPLGTTTLTSSGGGTARYAAGRTATLPVIMGHRDTGYTACPGRYLYPYLGSIRTKARALMKASLLDPVGAPAGVNRGTAVSLSARALVAQTWRLDVTAPFGGGRVARISGSAQAGKPIKATWNGQVTGGGLARPGRYTLTLTSNSATGTARPVVDRVLVVPPAPAAEVPAIPSAGSGGYFPVTPTRLLDTRTGGRLGLGPAGRADLQVLGVAGVPSTGVTSVVLNLTASGASDDTALGAWPTGRRTVRTLTGVPAGLTRSVLVTSRVGGGGRVSVGNTTGVLELTVDVVGYFAAGGAGLRPVPSTRIYASSSDPAGKLVADRPRVIALPASVGGVPAEQITGVMVDVSALSPTGAGTLTAYRTSTASRLPTLSYRTGESIDNLAFVPVTGGTLTLQAAGTPVNAVLDVRAVMVAPVSGADPGARLFTAVKPALVVDTRSAGGAVRAGSPRRVVVTGTRTGVPAGASAVVVDLTAIAPAAKTWLQAYTWGGSTGGGTALRVSKGDTRGNLVVVPLDSSGAIGIANARGSVQVRVDVYGYLD